MLHASLPDTAVLPTTLESETLNIPVNPAFRLASDVVNGFESLRHGSFLSVADFSESFPLERLMLGEPKLFLRNDDTDPVVDLATLLGVTRNLAIKDFLAQNFNQLDSAMLKMLAVSNDVVIATVLANPFTATDKDFVRPIVDVIDDYLRIKRRPALLEFLPRVFEDRILYDTYFTHLEGFTVKLNGKAGFVTLIPDVITREAIANDE